MKKQLFWELAIAVVLTVILYILPSWKNQPQNVISPLANLFKQTLPSTISPNQPWTLLVTGDIIPARSVNFQMTKRNDFMWPLRGIASLLTNADLTLVNLESPLIANCPLTNEGMKFCGDQRFGASLKETGVDIVNLANNHSLNYGWEGLDTTEKLLNGLGIETTGFSVNCQNNIFCSKLAIKQIKNLKIGFLGYNTVGQKIDREMVMQQISEAKKSTDLLVISVHWGAEYQKEPVAESEDPKELGRWLVDQGVDLVVGNHPHQIQGQEFYQNKLILYAMGNTVFDQEWSSETKKGILVKLHFIGTDLQKDQIEIIPIGIRNYGEAFLREIN